MTASSTAWHPARRRSQARSAGGTEDMMNEHEFEAFYRRTAPGLRAYLRRNTGHFDVADDLLQDAYCRFLGAGFQGENERHRRGYLYRIATNLLRDRYRRRRNEVPLEEHAAPQVDPAAQSGVRADLQELLTHLQPRDRQLLLLAHFEGFSHREVAKILGLAETSIRSMLFRARQRLAAMLRQRGYSRENLP